MYFSVFRAVHGVLVLAVFYFFGYKANVGPEIYALYLLVSVVVSRLIFKKIKLKFNL
tara:strand:+ start:678 stop:848 length:171 start_codon:yes stop_codon:yes gene_type:complete